MYISPSHIKCKYTLIFIVMSYDSGRIQQINTDSEAAKKLGYSGSSNADFDQWYSGLGELEREYLSNENPVLLQYIQALNSTKDPYIRQQLEGAYANFKSQSFNPNLLQWFGELFGDTSSRANFNNQLNSGFSESIKNILEGMHAEEYTDPAADSARRRAAGINDDLTGGSQIGSGEPAKIDESQLAPGVVNDGTSGIAALGEIGSHFLSTAFQVFSGFQSLRSANLENDIKSLNLSGLLSDQAWKVIEEGTSEFLNNDTNYSPGTDVESIMDSKTGKLIKPLVENLKSRLKNLPYTNRNKRKIASMLDSLIYSTEDGSGYGLSAKYETLVRNLLTNLNKSRSDYAKSYGDIGSDTQSQVALQFIGKTIFTPLNELLLDVASKTNTLQLQYLDAAIKGDVGSLKAGAEGAKYKFQLEMGKVRSRITSSFSAINRSIVNSNDLTPMWKIALQAALASTEAYSFSRLLGGMN